MTDQTTPQRPTGLSGQEEEELRTLEKGYDPDGSALPDPDGQGNPAQKAGSEAAPQPPEPPAPTKDRTSRAQPKPLGDAEKRGMIPPDDVAAPPRDRPDDTADGVRSLDADPRRRRP